MLQLSKLQKLSGVVIIVFVIAITFLIAFPSPPKSLAKEVKPLYDVTTVDECDESPICQALPKGSGLDWAKDKALLENLSAPNPEKCNQIFNILWAWSKKRNFEARLDLVAQMSAYAGSAMIFPGPSFDYLTNQRHLLIMSVHSTGVDFGEEKNQWLDKRYNNVPMFGVNSKFSKCLQKERSEDCVEILIKYQKVPAFETFAKEIDLFIDAGYTAHCPGLSSGNRFPEIPLDQNIAK